MAVRSRLHVNADALLITSNLGYIVAVQQGCVVIWRLEDLGATVAYRKYMTDDFPADDEQLSDTDYFYEEGVSDSDEQVDSLSTCRRDGQSVLLSVCLRTKIISIGC